MSMASNLASPDLPGDRQITTSAAAEAAELLEDISSLTPDEADMVIQYACARYRRGEIQGARMSLRHHTDLTGCCGSRPSCTRPGPTRSSHDQALYRPAER